MEDPTIYFDTPAFQAAAWAFRNTCGTEADCLRAAMEAAAVHIVAAERERVAAQSSATTQNRQE